MKEEGEERMKTKIYRKQRKEIVGKAAKERKLVITTFLLLQV